MTEGTKRGPTSEVQEGPPARPGVWSALHVGLGAVLVGEDGCLLDANPAGLDLLGLAPADVGTRVAARLAEIAVCHEFGPNNSVVSHCSRSGDDQVGAHCVPMGASGSATTLYLLWDKEVVAKLLMPQDRSAP